MRELITNLALFIVFCLAFSSMTACTGTNAGNNNIGKAPAGNSQVSENKSANYPPVPSGIAEGEIELLDGSKTKISDHKGKVLIVNLWGIWCGPCRDEMPHLVAMQKQYADRGFEVIGLNIGDHDGGPEPVESIKRFGEQMKLEYTLARVWAPTIKQFYLLSKQESVPQSILVDREGHLRGVFVGAGPSAYAKMQETLDKLMLEG